MTRRSHFGSSITPLDQRTRNATTMALRVILAALAVAFAGLRHDKKVKTLTGVAPNRDDACSACVAAAGQTETWTQYCQCYVSNSNKWGSTAGGFSYEQDAVEDTWYWNCGEAGGDGYEVCKASTGSLYGDRGAGSGQKEFDIADR